MRTFSDNKTGADNLFWRCFFYWPPLLFYKLNSIEISVKLIEHFFTYNRGDMHVLCIVFFVAVLISIVDII